MNKHTPGPWGIKTTETGTKAVFSSSTGAWVAHTVRSLSSTQDANARLIAAAPDLLEALNRVLPQYEALLKDCGLRSLGTADQARAAIAKAEGKT